MKSKDDINQLKITIFDNKPNLSPTYWYEATGRQDYKARYKMRVWLLTQNRPIDLRVSMNWPPSDLHRRQHWINHRNQYELWVLEQHEIQAQARRGEIQALTPPLLGIPTEHSVFKGRNKPALHKWYVPQGPSLISSILMREQGQLFWRITWYTPEGNTVLFLNNDLDTETDAQVNKKGGVSNVLKKTWRHGFNIDPRYYLPYQADTAIQQPIDYEYEEFKQRIQQIFQANMPSAREEIAHLVTKFPEFADRMNNE
jgi:hypothetical protein